MSTVRYGRAADWVERAGWYTNDPESQKAQVVSYIH